LKKKLQSRKLWMTIAGAAASYAAGGPGGLIAYMKLAFPTYLVAQGATDAAAALKTQP
jgi:hypothetical protein